MKRLSQLLDPFTMMMTALGYKMEELPPSGYTVDCEGVRYNLELRDHSGPITTRELNDWLEQLGIKNHGVFVTMGFFQPKVYGYLIQNKLLSRIALLQMGLKSIYDNEISPRFIGEYDSKVFISLSAALISLELPPLAIEDFYDTGRAISYCQHCDHLLSKTSFISCPICGKHYCHPDVGECYFKHDCTGGTRGI